MFRRRPRLTPPPDRPFGHEGRCRTPDATPEWVDVGMGNWERAEMGVEIPPTFTVRTGKGRHYYFRVPAGLSLTTAGGVLEVRHGTSGASLVFVH